MDALPFITDMLSEPALEDFLSKNGPVYLDNLNLIVKELIKVQIYMKRSNFRMQPEAKKLALVEGLRLTVRKVGDFMREIVQQASSSHSSSSRDINLVKDWKETLNFISGIVVSCNYLKQTEAEDELEHNDIDAVTNFSVDMKSIESSLLEPTDSSNTANCRRLTEEESRALLLEKAFPALGELKEPTKVQNFLLELSKELDNLPQLICKASNGVPLALVLIGSLLSLKERTYDVWKRVKDELCKFNEFDNHDTADYLLSIITYCYEDLPYFLKPCFLYLACYPICYPIPVRSLTEIWIAEGFITAEEKETAEETASKYLKQLVQRSLVQVTQKSLLDTIKVIQVNPFVHEFVIKQSFKEGFMVANPDKEIMESLFRLAIHHNNNEQYTELENNHIHSFLAFDCERNVIGSAVFLRVLELRKSAIPETALPDMTYLRYLGLRGSNISTLPQGIGLMKNLQTLDVRDTNINTVPESLWSISTLRHVYVKPSPEIKGPPASADIKDLQILKTVAVPESWQDNIPHFLISVRKLALSNLDDLDWKSVSNLLSKLVNLLSIAIIGNNVPSEFVDTRAFRNLETVTSIRLDGKWNRRKLLIDNVKFPTNLTKLTLTNSGLKEDPMPRLEKLQALKLLSLRDGAYTGKQTVCSAKGFPCLQFLELSKLENLENWVVEAMAMSELRNLRVVHCEKLNIPPELSHVALITS